MEAPAPPLPYSPTMARLLRPLQRGFLVLNGAFMAPALRLGLGRFIGNPFTGHILLLRTRGRRSGLIREAPLGYVIRDGAVLVVAGYGTTTPWYLNLLAEPSVEVLLTGRRPFHGHAEPIVDDGEWAAAYRTLIASFGFLGRTVAGDIDALSDAELIAQHRALPVIRIVPDDPAIELRRGTWDPGGLGWLWANLAATVAGLAFIAIIRARPSRATRSPRDRASRRRRTEDVRPS